MSGSRPPRVSVVIPTLGRPEMVTRAVLTVLAQTMADLEVIVVIDGDDAATRDAMAAISDDRLRVISHEVNRGAGQARDTGGEASRGDWVAYLDDDDEWTRDKLELQLADAPAQPAILTSVARVVTPTGVFVRPSDPYAGDQPLDEWLFGRRSWLKGGQSFLQTSSLMVPRAVVDAIKFRDALQHEDWEFTIRAVKQLGYPLITTTTPVVIHYLGDVRPSLSKTHTWRRSLDWIDSLGEMITPRAYAGFCLTVITQVSSNAREYEAFAPLLRAAFARGAPTARQLFAFSLLWLLPERLRRRFRALVQGERKAA